MAVSAWERDEPGQPIEQLERGQMQDGTPVRHGPGEAVDQAVVVFAGPGHIEVITAHWESCSP